MNESTKRTLLSAMAVIVLLSACTAAPAPTQDPALIQQLIEQSVELTVAAHNAEATAQQALIVPSNTPLPTQTEVAAASPTPIVPTATPFVIVPPTSTFSSGGGGAVPTARLDYACDAISRRPFDNTVFRPNDSFDIKWTIVNTGTKTWRAGLDLKYFSGPQIANTNFIELPALKPGEEYVVILDAIAPAKLGRHVMTWTVEGQICFPYVAIQVEK